MALSTEDCLSIEMRFSNIRGGFIKFPTHIPLAFITIPSMFVLLTLGCKSLSQLACSMMNITRHPERGNRILKIADKYIGIPAVCLLGLFHRKSPRPPSQLEKIAILKTAGIGDTIILSAVIDDIKKSLPHSEITFICGQNNHEICKRLGSVDKIVPLRIRNFFRCIKTILSLDKFDVWLDFGPWPRFNSILSYFSNAQYKVGFKTRKQYRHYVYDKVIEHVDHAVDCHELLNYRNVASAIGISCNSLPHISLNCDCSTINEKQVAMHVLPGGSQAHLKEWPPGHWISLIDWFTDNNYTVYLTGSAHDLGRLQELRHLANRPADVIITAGQHSLLDTAKLLAASRLVVSIDTGTMHMASALGCNLIAIHGPTSSKRWGPLNVKSSIIETTRTCAPCIDLGFDSNCRDNKCMSNITPGMVIEACRKTLSAH